MSSTAVPPKAQLMVETDITNFDIDSDSVAIVNASNSKLGWGGGVCGAIFQAANGGPSTSGSSPLDEQCKKLGKNGIVSDGGAVTSDSFELGKKGKKNIKKIIHAVGPVWSSYPSVGAAKKKLEEAYTNSLQEAENAKMKTVVFSVLSSAIFAADSDPLVYAERRKLAVITALEAFEKYKADYAKRSDPKEPPLDVRFICGDGDDDLREYFTIGLKEGGIDLLKKQPPIITKAYDASAGKSKDIDFASFKHMIEKNKDKKFGVDYIVQPEVIKRLWAENQKSMQEIITNTKDTLLKNAVIEAIKPKAAEAATPPPPAKPGSAAPGSASKAAPPTAPGASPGAGSPAGGSPTVGSSSKPASAKPPEPQPAKPLAPQPAKTAAPQVEDSSITSKKPVRQQSATEPTGPGTATLSPTGGGSSKSEPDIPGFPKTFSKAFSDLCARNERDNGWKIEGAGNERKIIVSPDTEFVVTPKEITFNKCKDYRAFAELLIAQHGPNAKLHVYHTDENERQKMIDAFKALQKEGKFIGNPPGAMPQVHESKDKWEAALKVSEPEPGTAPSPERELTGKHPKPGHSSIEPD